MTFLFAQPKEWWLEVSSPQQAKFWEQSQQHVTPNSRWNAYINRVCLYTVLDLIQDNAPEARIWLDVDNMSAVWDVVNGSAITIGTTKLVIIPTEAIDDGELEVPQEWVDIPNWVGDYYIVVQFRPEGNFLRIWGYTTHQELKNNSEYDPDDRTYCLDALLLTHDMDTLWVRHECYPEAPTRAHVSPLPELSVTQAENLIGRLGDAALVFPRLSVPFATWGALQENDIWRQNLYATRRGIQVSNISQLTRLSEWLRGGFDNIWQTIEDTFAHQQVATAWRSQNTQNLTSQNQNSIFIINRVKILDFSSLSGNEQVALLIGILPINDIEVTIGFEIRPLDNVDYLPDDVQVRLLDENGVEVGIANAAVTQTIQFQFSGQPGERFSIEVACSGKVITEHFVI
ncbi:DUF1822 family protein [Iningainema tapete]|uniref:DUF1822 family protein n=1 Tax=Iningainema tapete BLCC-T55 TaxID=2748662 RepID=A0A8J6XDF3_9CYAN|nr:DUF1822 family protein [Iningainema tapete BLCC-T55]